MMNFHIKTLVFNESYINDFLNYSFPSLLSPNNFPAIGKIANVEYHVYTRSQQEVERITHELAKFNIAMDLMAYVRIAPIPEIHFNSGIATHAQENFFEYFTRHNSGDTPILFSNSDVIWSDGSLSYIAKSIEQGSIAVFPPIMRGATETFTQELDAIKKDNVITLPPLLANQLLLKHFSPLFGTYNHKSQHYPEHAELFFVPVGTEGVLFYYSTRPFFAFVPGKLQIICTSMINEDFYNHKMDTIHSSMDCLGISLSPLSQNLDWIRDGFPFDPCHIKMFMNDSRWSSAYSFNLECLKHPTRIPIVDNINEELWQSIEKEVRDTIIKEIIEYNGGKREHTRNPISDKQLQIEALEWLEPVINGRFSQAVLELLRKQ